MRDKDQWIPIIKNFSYLSLIQIIGVLLPLVYYPYLIRVLGANVYGLVIFATAVISYFQMFIIFGFNVSGAKLVSLNIGNNNKISEIVSSIIVIRLLFFVLSLAALYIVLMFLPSVNGHKLLFFLTMMTPLSDVLSSFWYFQGKENMKIITIVTIVSRIIFVLLIFLFVKNKSDYCLVPFLSGIGGILAACISVYFIFIKDKVQFFLPNKSVLVLYVKDGWVYFVSFFFNQCYTQMSKVLLGVFAGMNYTAYYDLAEKFTLITRNVINALGQAIFPRMVKTKDFVFMKKVMKITLALSLLFVVAFIPMTKYVVLLFGGAEMLPSIPYVRLFSIILIPFVLAHFYTYQSLIVTNNERLFMRIQMSTILVYFVCVGAFYFILPIMYNLLISTILVDTYIAIMGGYYTKKLKLHTAFYL